MARSPASPGDLERAVMEQLWARGAEPGTSVRAVHEALAGERDLAYTTVMTVLDRLAKKGLATRERDGRAWLYRAASSREQLTGDALRQTMDGVEPQNRRAAMLHFLGGASAGEIEDLRAALAAVEARGDQPTDG